MSRNHAATDRERENKALIEDLESQDQKEVKMNDKAESAHENYLQKEPR